MIEILVEDYIEDLEESQIGTGDQESRALIATKAKWLMKKALKSGKKQSQAWWNKQVRLAGIDDNDKPAAVLQAILATKEETSEEIMSTVSDVDMNPTGKSKKKMKRKCETFSVSDDCFHMFRHGKTKFERWSKYLDLTDTSQKKIYDWARRHHNGTIILKNAQTGQVRGIRYNRTGGGKWGTITRLKEQVLKTNQEFTVK